MFSFKERKGKIHTESAIDIDSGRFNVIIMMYEGKYITNFFRFTLHGYLSTNFTASEDQVQVHISCHTNFTHFYLLDLETYKSVDNVTATITWKYATSEADFDVTIHDLKTSFKAHLGLYETVHCYLLDIT